MNNIMNEDVLMLQAVERYLDGTMLPDEKAYFEQLRKSSAEIDQLVVEHNMFLHQMDNFASQKQLKQSLNAIHAKLLTNGDINEGGVVTPKGKVVQLWNKYKRDMAIAASVAGAIAITISGLFSYFSPGVNGNQLQQLSKDIAIIKYNQQVQGTIINEVKSKLPEGVKFVSGGTGFLIDGKGYIITNAHVLKGNGAIVINNKGQEFSASIKFVDVNKDLAILKITDAEYEAIKDLPYGIAKNNEADLGEEIFTLGYPRTDNAIVYTQGYLSAASGFQGDSISCQIQMSSNPGNSGGPVLNKEGEVLGILSKRQTHADGVTFAIKSKIIYRLVDEVAQKDTSLQKLVLSPKSTIKNKNRITQVKKIEDCVFSVKAYNNR